MNTKKISFQQFVAAFDQIINKPIWRIIHPADGWLIIDFGQKYISSLPGKNGVDEPYEKGDCQLYIKGDWEIYNNDVLFETSNVIDSDQKQYFSRMDYLTKNFPIQHIHTVEYNTTSILLFGDVAHMSIDISANPDAIRLTVVEINTSNIPITHTHYRYDQKMGSYIKIQAWE